MDDLFSLSKLEKGSHEILVTAQKGDHHLKGLFANFESLATNRDQEYAYEVEVDSETLWYDRNLLDTVCYNILSNAFKYSPVGASIQSKVYDKEGKLFIRISDSGPGLSEVDRENIFDRFYRSKELDAYQTGMGIGLSLVKELLDLIEGEVKVESKLDEGTEFLVTLPTTQEHYSRLGYAIGKVRHQPDNELKVPPIIVVPMNEKPMSFEDLPVLLIVEDNRDMRMLINDLFSEEFRIIQAADGKEGLDIALEHIPDMIISDMMMPEMDGYEMCEQLKTDTRTSHIPIIILTALAEDVKKLETLEIGVDDYLAKPFHNRELKLRTRNLIDRIKTIQDKYSASGYINPEDISSNSTDMNFWKKVETIIKENLSDSSFTIVEFSNLMHMSRMQLHRKLKALTNLSASAFLRSQRLKAATELLTKTDLTVSEIAYDVGFTNPFYFSKCFKESYGKTPSEFRS